MAVAPILTSACLCSATAALVCAWRIYSQGLAALYPAALFYLISQGVLLTVASLLGVGSVFYFWFYVYSYPITWIVYCFMVRSLYNDIFRKYPGIAMFGRWSVYAAVALAGGIAIASHLATHRFLHKSSVVLVSVQYAGRDITWALALCLVVLLIVISRYPIELHRNVLVNCAFFGAILLAEASVLLTDHLTNFAHTLPLDLLLMIFNTVCLSIWGFLLSPQGATRVVRVRRNFSKNDEYRLLAQLGSINALGARMARK